MENDNVEENFHIYKVPGNKLSKASTDLITNTFLGGFASKEFKNMSTTDKMYYVRGIKEYIQDKNKIWYMVYSDFGKIISIIALIENPLTNNQGRVNPSFQYELQAITTSPKYRGKGFVKDLISYICKTLDKAGLWLEVNENNPAMKAYKKLGFEIYEEIPQKEEDEEELETYEEGQEGKRFKMIMLC